MGRFGAASRPPMRSAAVSAPFWPNSALVNTAGEASAAMCTTAGRRSGRMAKCRSAIVPKVQSR